MERTPAATTSQTASPLVRWGRRLRSALVCAFVVWHLFFLLLRNPLDLWWDDIKGGLAEQAWWAKVEPYVKPADPDTWKRGNFFGTWKYGNFFGIDQGWTMFGPPVARSAPFLAARIEFSDGSQDMVYSVNEPDPTAFFRAGGWRQRKLEDYLARFEEADLRQTKELPLWEAYVRWCVRRWRQTHPEDPREPERVVLLKRRIHFPNPGEDPSVFEDPEVTTLGSFNPDGRLR
jgi:hypothetical protein